MLDVRLPDSLPRAPSPLHNAAMSDTSSFALGPHHSSVTWLLQPLFSSTVTSQGAHGSHIMGKGQWLVPPLTVLVSERF